MDGRARAAREVVITIIRALPHAPGVYRSFLSRVDAFGLAVKHRLFEVTAQPSSGWSETLPKLGFACCGAFSTPAASSSWCSI